MGWHATIWHKNPHKRGIRPLLAKAHVIPSIGKGTAYPLPVKTGAVGVCGENSTYSGSKWGKMSIEIKTMRRKKSKMEG